MSPPARSAPPDVYLMPTVVGGGRGDVEEVLAVGRALASAGHRTLLLRLGGRPLPRGVGERFDWPAGLVRLSRLRPRRRRAVVIASWWGVTVAPESPGLLGRAGPWAREAEEVERTYGADATLHVSLEEFARTLVAREQEFERWREGGRPIRTIRHHLARPEARREVDEARRLYRTFRALDRPNLLCLFPSFSPSAAFAREFPEAVQCGPVSPAPARAGRGGGKARRSGQRWIWYASPSSSERLIAFLLEGLARARAPVRLEARGIPPGSLPPGGRWSLLPPLGRDAWTRRLANADVAIVTGSRTLLEALEARVPFLYFNGVTGSGRSLRRHRPEKLRALLSLWRGFGVPASFRRDLGDFARMRRAGEIVARASSSGWQREFPRPGVRTTGYPSPYDRAERLILSWVRRFAGFEGSAARFASEERERATAVLLRPVAASSL